MKKLIMQNHEHFLHNSWTVDRQKKTIRADAYLVYKFKRISRERVKKLIIRGDFTLNNQKIKPSRLIKGGENALFRYKAPDKENASYYKEIKIIYENEQILIIDKPPTLAVHPCGQYYYNTLTAWLKIKYPKQTPHPCHRLDRETSGIIVCAKNKEVESVIKKKFMRGQIAKEYKALVRGRMLKPEIIDIPLIIQGDAGLVFIKMVVNNKGLPSVTKVWPIRYNAIMDQTLVLCEAKTGRQHQIRAHLSHIGHPIVGDKLYAMGEKFFDKLCANKSNESLKQLDHHRHALHASQLSFNLRDNHMSFTSSLPRDLQILCACNSLKA